MKNFLPVLLAAALMFSLCACEKQEQVVIDNRPAAEETESTPEESAAPTEKTGTTTVSESAAPEETTAPIVSARPTIRDVSAGGFTVPQSMVCTLDAQGIKMQISFPCDVTNVSFCTAVYDMETFVFSGAGAVLKSYGDLAAGAEIGICTYLPDVLTTVVLCYTDGGGSHTLGIFQSGEDGSLLLSDAYGY